MATYQTNLMANAGADVTGDAKAAANNIIAAFSGEFSGAVAALDMRITPSADWIVLRHRDGLECAVDEPTHLTIKGIPRGAEIRGRTIGGDGSTSISIIVAEFTF